LNYLQKPAPHLHPLIFPFVSVQVRGDLIKSGFVANNEKSVWKPVQSIEWLGFIWNLSSGTL
jgi:hypothetical protein